MDIGRKFTYEVNGKLNIQLQLPTNNDFSYVESKKTQRNEDEKLCMIIGNVKHFISFNHRLLVHLLHRVLCEVKKYMMSKYYF